MTPVPVWLTKPTWSPEPLPTRLLAAETVPMIPVVPFPHVTAPVLPYQEGLSTT
jgi:hypothetical protein